MAKDVNGSFRADANRKSGMEQTRSALGMSMAPPSALLAEEKRLPLDGKPVDPFYSESNLRYLESLVRDVEEGRAHFAEHELLNADDAESAEASAIEGA